MEPLDRPPAKGGWAVPDSQAGDPAVSRRPPASGSSLASSAPPVGEPGPGVPDLPVPLAPMTLSDLLDGAFRVLKLRPRTVLGIAAAILVPVFMVAAFLQRDAANGYTLGSGLSVTQVLATSGGAVVGEYLAAILLAASLFFLGGALGRLVSAWYAGGDLTAEEALGAAFRRTPALLAAFAMLLPVKVISGLMCYLPVIPCVTLFSVTAPAIVIEGIGPVAGARRSWQLVARRFWPSVGIIVVATLGSSLLTVVLTVLPTGFALILPNPAQWIVIGVIRSAVALVIVTTLVSVSVLLYLDLRIRTEGLDLELAAADAFVHGP